MCGNARSTGVTDYGAQWALILLHALFERLFSDECIWFTYKVDTKSLSHLTQFTEVSFLIIGFTIKPETCKLF